MYTPSFNREEDLPTLRAFVREHSLCALVTKGSSGLMASHLPMVLHEGTEGFGVLRGHLARANSQWREFGAEDEVLGIFTGEQHYVSPAWYPAKQEHGKVVPTWNYVAVHVYGTVRVVEDAEWLLEHLNALTDKHEGAMPAPWKVSDAPEDFIRKQLAGIVGVELTVMRVEGKWKVSQNRNDEDAKGVVEGLASLGTPDADAMSELVGERRPRKAV